MFSVITGRLGSGKSLLVASLIEQAATDGRRIVANFDLNFDQYTFTKPLDCTIIPTRPSSDILKSIGRGSDLESKPGLLVIDEGAMVLNSRTWNDKDRDNIIAWFLMSRKLNWDVYVIIQHVSALDKQIREMFCEIYITCMRLDRIKIPLLGAALPRLHIAVGRYGSMPNAPIVERWYYRGNKKLYSLYNTSYIFDPDKTQEVKYLTAKIKKSFKEVLKERVKSFDYSNLLLLPIFFFSFFVACLFKSLAFFYFVGRSKS